MLVTPEMAGLQLRSESKLNANFDSSIVRAVLGLFNSIALISYASGVRRAYGKATAAWFTALQASQFHVLYYYSRTLPNMFAFGISKKENQNLVFKWMLSIAPPPCLSLIGYSRSPLLILMASNCTFEIL